MQFSIVNYKTVKELETYRFDAEYFKSEYLEAEHILKVGDYSYFEDFAFITDGIHSSIDFDEKSNVLLFSAKAPKENTFDTSKLKKISEKQHKKNPRTSLQENDVIISTVGTIGNCAVVTKELLPANSDRHVGIIRSKKVSPFFLSTFLLSKYGRMQTSRNIVGNVQPNLYIMDIKKFILPTFPQSFHEQIEKIVRKALNKQYESKNLYSQAQNILLSELGLLDWKPNKYKSYIKNYSDTQKSSRMDAEYFDPNYEEVEIYLKNKFKALSIRDLNFIEVTTGQYSLYYVSKLEGKPYIRGTDLLNGTVNMDNLVYIDPNDQRKDKKAKEGDVVVTRVGSIGLSARIPLECTGGTISDNLIRLRISDKQYLDSYFLMLFLGSKLGKGFMIRYSRGSVQQRLNQETLKEIVIPIIKMEKQLLISKHIISSYYHQKQSKTLLEIAKKGIEMAIEKNEKEAENWINSEI